MAEITITVPDNHAHVPVYIPNNQIGRLSTAMKALYPIPQTINPEYDEITNPDVPEYVNEYTDKQWGRICILNWLKSQVHRYEEGELKKAVVVPSITGSA